MKLKDWRTEERKNSNAFQLTQPKSQISVQDSEKKKPERRELISYLRNMRKIVPQINNY